MENKLDTQNQQQMLAYELIANMNSSFFLTGRAGTGKTTFLRKVQQMVDKQFITLAPTGVAAILAGGDTIHSFFGLPMDVYTPGTCGKLNEARILTLLHADTIIIDEVSNSATAQAKTWATYSAIRNMIDVTSIVTHSTNGSK